MEYKNVRPMIKKLGIKGTPVTVSTASGKNTLSSLQQDHEGVATNTLDTQQTVQQGTALPVENNELINQKLEEKTTFESDTPSTYQTNNLHESGDDSMIYRVGDIAKSFDHVEKKGRVSKRVVGDTIPTDVQKVDSLKRAQEEENFNGILSSVKTLKTLTQFDKTPANTSKKINKQERYQPMNPNAEKMVRLLEGNDNSTISFKPNTDPIRSRTDTVALITQLEKEKEQRQYSSTTSNSSSIRPLPFSEVDLRDFFTQEELQKPVQPLEPVPFKTIDLRKTDLDNQTEFWEMNHTQPLSEPLKGSTPTKNTTLTNNNSSTSYTSSLNHDDFSLKELDIKDDDLYGEVVEQKTVEKEEKKNFVSADAKSVSSFAWLAYILFFIPLLINRKSAYVRHSANEGLEINFVDVLGIICILVGKFVQPTTLIAEGVLIGLMIMGSILLVLTTVTKIFMIVATLKGRYVSTPWFWNIEIIR